MPNDVDDLLGRLVEGRTGAGDEILIRAWTDNSPPLLVAAAMLADEHRGLIARAARHAVTTRDRQLVAIAGAYFDRDEDRLDALAGDHLSEHPDNALAAWIAGRLEIA
jgi:hypothetical protein